MEGAAKFMGIDLVNEKELVLIVSRTSEKNAIMKAIMDNADKKAGSIVFSLPVTDTAGLRLLDEKKEEWVEFTHTVNAILAGTSPALA